MFFYNKYWVALSNSLVPLECLLPRTNKRSKCDLNWSTVDESGAESGWLSTVSHQNIPLLILFLQTHLPEPRDILPSVLISVLACSRHLTSSVGQSTTEETTAASEPARALWRGLGEEVGGEQPCVHVCVHHLEMDACIHMHIYR